MAAPHRSETAPASSMSSAASSPPASQDESITRSARGPLAPPFVDAERAVPDAIDVDFTVPITHRLRFTQDVFGPDADVLLDVMPPGGESLPKVLVYCDAPIAKVNPDLRERIETVLEDRVDLVAPVQLVVGGEACKNDPAVIDRMLADINRFDMDRRSYIVVIGGGAVLDAVGYAAAVAHRGVRLVRLPATTLAQDDSGVGVKNAVNWFDKKNWKGTFASPWAVINDRRLLDSLPDRDFRAGFSEAVKVALLKDAAFFDRIRQAATQIADRDWDACDPVIRESAVWHLRHITRGGDPFEALEARPLDFGHWSAHKLEPMSGYAVRHGEAVAIGLAIDVAYSVLRHGLSEADRDAIHETLENLGLPLAHPLITDTDVLLDGLEEFRQHLGGRLTVTMISAPGEPVDVHEIDTAAMREAIEFCCRRAGLSDNSTERAERAECAERADALERPLSTMTVSAEAVNAEDDIDDELLTPAAK